MVPVGSGNAGSSRCILIADDARLTRLHLKVVLQRMGFDVIEAANGKEAVLEYRAAKPYAVVMDLHMPQMDGVSALKEIRQGDPEARVIILSSEGERGGAARAAKAAGAADFIVKPWSERRLQAALASLPGGPPAPPAT